MRQTPRFAAIVIAGLSTVATVATAPAVGGDVVLPTEWASLGSATLDADEGVQRDVVIGVPDVVGFELAFDYSEPVSDDSWASDLQVVVRPPVHPGYTVGGQTNLPLADAEWSFQGEISDGSGHYGDSGADAFLPWLDTPLNGGLWSLRFTNDWTTDPNVNVYGDIRVRFYVVLPPTCPEDVDEDGAASFGDVLRILAAWGSCPGCPEDVDGDDMAGFSDVLRVLAAWGPCP